VLNDDELRALSAIERQLRRESPHLVRLFDIQASDRRRRAMARTLLAAAATTGLVLLAPRVLTEAEVRLHNQARAAHRTVSTPRPIGEPILLRATD
jgi:hypothetical protein